MTGDHFPAKYFPEGYFPAGYFQGGEANPNAMSASLSGSGGILGATLTASAVAEESGGKGGWDPYYYKKRNARRDKKRDVVRFVEEVAQPDLSLAPEAVQEQAREALESARLALVQGRAAVMQTALREINEFYALIRAETKRLRGIEDEYEEELLLLAA